MRPACFTRSTHRTPARVLVALVPLVLVLGGSLWAPTGRPTHAAGDRPDIVLILTDDQRWDTLWAMPSVQGLLGGRGITFANAFVVNALCCPSRATVLTGQYSHSHGVYRNGDPPYGGFSSFPDASTIATWLHDDGYHTGLVGKYMGGYSDQEAGYVPPGWDRWFAFTSVNGNGSYFDYDLSVDGLPTSYGSDPEEYSTDVLAAEADAFIRGTEPDQPLFLYMAPRGPHEPAVPAPRHADTFGDLPPLRPPSYDEVNVSDKPEHIRDNPPMTQSTKDENDLLRVNQYRSLLAVDEAVARIVSALEETGRLSTAMIVFASDNGFLLGEHRHTGKKQPYEESIRIPFVVRYDPLIGAARTDGRIVLNMDLASTFAEIAGVPAPAVDGKSLIPLLSSPAGTIRADFLIENSQTDDRIPPYCGVRGRRYAYVAYNTGDRELYDLKTDPYQLKNRVSDPALAGTLTAMHARMIALCSPAPPRFDPSIWD